MMIGQAAGALAALAIEDGVPPRDLPPMRVQRALLEAEVVLSLCKYSDVPPEHPFYNSVQLSNLYGLIDPAEPPHASSYNISDLDDPVLAMSVINGADKGIFGVDEMVTKEEMVVMLNRARAASKTSFGRDVAEDEWSEKTRFATRGLFADGVAAAFGLFGTDGGSSDRHSAGISQSHRFSKAVTALTDLGILDLYEKESEFRPARPVTRGEAAQILMKAMTVRRTGAR
jgi:hypothetical protein